MFLRELIRLDGRGDHRQFCQCANVRSQMIVDAEYRCRDCFGGGFLCQSCIVKCHISNPLHSIEVHSLLISSHPSLTWWSLAMEWNLFWSHYSQVSRASNPTGSLPWWTLPLTIGCIQWCICHNRYSWHPWSGIRLLRMWNTGHNAAATAALSPLSSNCSNS